MASYPIFFGYHLRTSAPDSQSTSYLKFFPYLGRRPPCSCSQPIKLKRPLRAVTVSSPITSFIPPQPLCSTQVRTLQHTGSSCQPLQGLPRLQTASSLEAHIPAIAAQCKTILMGKIHSADPCCVGRGSREPVSNFTFLSAKS